MPALNLTKMIRAAAPSAILRTRHPKSGLELSYDSSIHTFKYHGSQVFTSVEKLVERCIPPEAAFRRNEVAAQIAQREQRSVDDVVKDWRQLGLLSKNVASHVSLSLKNLSASPDSNVTAAAAAPLPRAPLLAMHGDEPDFFAVADRAVSAILEEYDLVSDNILVCDPQLKLAGKIDYLFKAKAPVPEPEPAAAGEANSSGSVVLPLFVNLLVHPSAVGTSFDAKFRFSQFDANSNNLVATNSSSSSSSSPLPLLLPPFQHLANSHKRTKRALCLALCSHLFRSQGYSSLFSASEKRKLYPFLKEPACSTTKNGTTEMDFSRGEYNLAVLEIGRRREDNSVDFHLCPVAERELLFAPDDCGEDQNLSLALAQMLSL